jgi:hypothetical protein
MSEAIQAGAAFETRNLSVEIQRPIELLRQSESVTLRINFWVDAISTWRPTEKLVGVLWLPTPPNDFVVLIFRWFQVRVLAGQPILSGA